MTAEALTELLASDIARAKVAQTFYEKVVLGSMVGNTVIHCVTVT